MGATMTMIHVGPPPQLRSSCGALLCAIALHLCCICKDALLIRVLQTCSRAVALFASQDAARGARRGHAPRLSRALLRRSEACTQTHAGSVM